LLLGPKGAYEQFVGDKDDDEEGEGEEDDDKNSIFGDLADKP